MFQFGGQQYLLLTDQYSRFPIIRRLTSTTSSAVINHLKSIFAEHGIPLQLVADNGPQYSSAEFDGFMTTYGVEHITSSPMYPQSNGSAERMVQTVENILRKWEEDKILILLFCSTEPHPWTTSSSPPQICSPTENSKPDYLCTSETLLTAVAMKPQESNLQVPTRKEKEAQYYNQRSGPPKKKLDVDQPIRMYTHKPGSLVLLYSQPRSQDLTLSEPTARVLPIGERALNSSQTRLQ